MSISLGILFGIIAMIGWGLSDFFVAKIVKKTSIFKTFFWSQAISLIPFFAIFVLFFKIPFLTSLMLFIIFTASLLGFIGLMSLYKSFQIGVISIVSPVAASSSVITVILSLVFLKETLSGLQAIGVSLAILGAILVSFKFHDLIKLKLKNIAAGVEFAVVAMLAWGISFVLIDVMVAELGWFIPVFFIKVLGVVFALAYAAMAKKDIKFPANFTLLIISVAALEAVAFLSIGAGIGTDLTAIVVPIASAFPAITIILARIFFKEILDINQKIGVAAVLLGLVLLSI